MNAYILTEGGKKTGFGHIIRCVSLYEGFRKYGIKAKLIVNGDESVKAVLKAVNYKIFDWLKKQKYIFPVLKKAEFVIVDSYLASSNFYKRLSTSDSVCVFVDDNKRISYPRGNVLNWTPCARQVNFSQKKGVRYLLGVEYTPLRREFWRIPDKKIKKRITKIMVTLGGCDTRNLTPRIMRFLNENKPKAKKTIIIGKGFSNINEINSIKNKNTELVFNPNAEGILKIMLEADIAISAGGQTLYELARVGVPTISIGVAENQINNIKGWINVGFVEHAGIWEDSSLLNNIAKKMDLISDSKIRLKKKEIAKIIIDGKGIDRIIDFCIDTYENKNK